MHWNGTLHIMALIPMPGYTQGLSFLAAGYELSDVEVVLPPNSLLLQMSDGWYIHPPLLSDAAISRKASIDMQRKRTSSVRMRFQSCGCGEGTASQKGGGEEKLSYLLLLHVGVKWDLCARGCRHSVACE